MEMNYFLQRLKSEVDETKNARLKIKSDSKQLKTELKVIRENVRNSVMVKPKTVKERQSQNDRLAKTI